MPFFLPVNPMTYNVQKAAWRKLKYFSSTASPLMANPLKSSHPPANTSSSRTFQLRTFCQLNSPGGHNIELWRGQFRRPHCAAILDDLCSVWADMHIEVEEDMKMLVLENVLSAISTTSSEDFCNISVRTSAGRELVLTLDGLSDMKRFEQLLRVTTSVSITKIVDRADGHLQPHQLSNIAHRVDSTMKTCKKCH